MFEVKPCEPLAGLLVVSIEQAVAAPFCTSRLADAGARVIKIERPEGDFARGYDKVVNGGSAYFDWLNRGKESLCVDLKNPDDAGLLHRILARADVFIQNLAPGAAARLGFGSQALRNRYPRLVTCDVSGYGEDGPMAARKAYDLLIQCETGLASITGSPEQPGRVGVSVADLTCGLNAYTGVLEALMRRERNGRGSGVAVSLFDSMAEWMAVPLLHYDYGKAAPGRMGIAHPSIAPYGVFHSAEGAPVVISIQNEREWRLLAERVMRDPALSANERFHGNSARVALRSEVDGLVAASFGSLMRAELVARLDAAGIAFAEVNGVSGLSRHPHLRRITADGPEGPVQIPAPPVRWADRSPVPGVIPAMGGQTGALREEFAAQTAT